MSSNCPICLGEFRDKAIVQPCLHEFCFLCIREWSLVSPSCPLCKRQMDGCLHQIHADDLYTRYRFPAPGSSISRVFSQSTSSPVSHHRPSHFRQRRPREYAAELVEERRPDTLIIRQLVYKFKVRAKHVGSNVHSRYRDISPQGFQRDPSRLERLRPWLRRELGVVLKEVDVLLIIEFIEGVLKRYPLPSTEAVEALRPFLFEDTELFIHELISFARSPYSIETYDQQVQYDWPDEAIQILERTRQNVAESSAAASSSTSNQQRKRRRSTDDDNEEMEE